MATFGIHLVANGGYGFFRDELYFIVCGQRPAWGYVDQPPLIPLIARFMWTISGGSLPVFRVAPALAMAVTVALTAEFARTLGGGGFAQALAGLCAFGASIFLGRMARCSRRTCCSRSPGWAAAGASYGWHRQKTSDGGLPSA